MFVSQRIYLESTVWYQMANYSPSEFKTRAEALFQQVEKEKYSIYISNVVLEEFNYNTSKYIDRVLELLTKYKPLVLMPSVDADIVAEAYLENAFRDRPRREVIVDAYHVAVAVTSGLTYMASYNYRNLLNVHILDHINAVNLIAGLNRHLSILPPFMFLQLTNYEGEKGSIHESVWDIKATYGDKLVRLLGKKPSKRGQSRRKAVAKIARELDLKIVHPSEFVY